MVYERSTPDARVATIDAPALGCSIALLEVARKWRRRRESDPAKSVRFVSDRHFWHDLLVAGIGASVPRFWSS